jgi:hypothetical protein
MPIQVTCPGCHKRFSVSEKFAGQKGPCPNCKAVIQIPSKSEEVVVHAPEGFGPKDAAGRPVLKPITRSETSFSVPAAAVIGVIVALVLIAAVIIRVTYKGEVPTWILGVGAVLLGPSLAYAGYSFLRNDDLEPHRGRSLWIRSLICGLVYAALWGLYALGLHLVLDGEQLELFQLLYVAPVFLAIGAGTAFACFDLDFGTGAIHYAFYLLVTIVLRLLMGMSTH